MNRIMEYLSFGRHSRFFVQSVVLSSLFLLVGRVWTIPMTLTRVGNENILVGLIGTATVISFGVGGVIYESGKRTYSPRFNNIIQCALAASLHILVGTSLVVIAWYYVTFVFKINYNWSVELILANLYVVGSLYALAVAAWHYQRVLSVDYNASGFEQAGRTIIRLLENIEDLDPPDEKIIELCEAIESLEEHCIEPQLSGEEELVNSIYSFTNEFANLDPDRDLTEIRLIITGKYIDGKGIDDEELVSLHQSLSALENKLSKVL